MIRSDSDNSATDINEQFAGVEIDEKAEVLPPIDDEEIRQVQNAFSDMIDQTCTEGLAGSGNIFEHTFIPRDWYGFLFRSIVPTTQSVQQHLEHELPQQFFRHDHRDGVKYAFKVLDRRTNRLIYEQMPTYQKYGMRLLFSGPIQRELLHKRAIKSFFARETRRLGKAFDDPKSCKHIPAFVKSYQIDLTELRLQEIAQYRTFNEFFYRALKAGARPIANDGDRKTVVSAADCRLMVFENIDEATRLWIKGRHFSLKQLFHDDGLADEFDGGSLAVFRLAPVDYHRFHSPVGGRIGRDMHKITGTYYTVNPIAIRENLDVLTRNQRTVVTIESETMEKVVFVAIGALLVGSVNFTVDKHQTIRKGDELGYFAYGGSTIVIVFKAGMVKWDNDLMHNSRNSMETLVRMGEQIGLERTSEERQEYLANAPKISKNNQTISKLFEHFPLRNSTK